jgi:hypothetical protein
MLKRLVSIGAAIGLLAIAANGSGVPNGGASLGPTNSHPPRVIDQRVALRIGPLSVSHYIIDKYYGRFIAGSRPPSPADTKRWLERFLAQMVVVAHAETLGYADRPEVRDIMDRMERTVLSQGEGPFYKSLYPEDPLSPSRLQACYARQSVLRKMLIARFDNETTAEALLGSDFDRRTIEEKRNRMVACRECEGALVYEGSLSWPFDPFIEIADALSAIRPGEWLECHDSLSRVYRAWVSSDTLMPQPDFAAVRTQVEQNVRQFDQHLFRNRRHAQLLAAAAFRFEPTVGQRVVACLRDLGPNAAQIPQAALAGLASAPLFHYRIADSVITVTVETYRRDFNARFIRQLPCSLAALRQGTEDMVTEELDCRSARAQGIDRAPQFIEDRRGFGYMQVLDCYEKDALLSPWTVAPEEIKRYYLEHAAEFRRVTRVRGRLLTFEDPAKTSPIAEEDLDVSINELPAGFENFQAILFQGPVGLHLGPIRWGNRFAVFIKDRDITTVLLPLAQVSPAIVAKLRRDYLDAKERDLAEALAPRFEIEDEIDYSHFGLALTEVATPWQRSQCKRDRDQPVSAPDLGHASNRSR